MTDGEALRRAVLAHPLEDVPRLAYADWCDENGRPDRARIIRLQCERETLADWDARAIEIDDQLTALGFDLRDDSFTSRALVEHLLADIPDESDRAAFADIWSRSSSGNTTNPCRVPRVRRGFADYFMLDDADCGETLDRLPALTPVTGVRLRGRAGAPADIVRRLPRPLRRLELAPWSTANLGGLPEHAPPNLTDLSLELREVNFAQVPALLSRLWPLIECPLDSIHLDFALSGLLISRLGFCGGGVRSFALSGARGDGLDRLFSSRWAQTFERVRLRQYEDSPDMTAPGLRALMTALAELPRLRALDLRHFGLTAHAWTAFVRAGGLAKCEEVTVSRQPKLGSAWLKHAAEGSPTALRRLNVYDCGFSTDHMQALVRGDHPHLVWLDLAHVHSLQADGLPPAGVMALAASPLCDRLRGLNLYNHRIGDDGAAALVARERAELRWLNLVGNTTQDGVAAVLLRGRLPNLVGLAVRCGAPADRLARKLGAAGPTDAPFTLNLSAPFTDDDIPALTRSRYLQSLRRVTLVYPQFTDKGKERLRAHFGPRLSV